jgi:hypothetical protein
MQLLNLCLIVVVCNIASMAQASKTDHCQVVTLDITGKKTNQIEDLPGKALGSFDTVRAEEERTTRVYPVPGTHLFVVASVWYTDESLASQKGADSISLELLVSKRPRRNISNALHFSDSEVPMNGFDVARVTTLIKSQRRTIFVIMECRNKSATTSRKERLI